MCADAFPRFQPTGLNMDSVLSSVQSFRIRNHVKSHQESVLKRKKKVVVSILWLCCVSGWKMLCFPAQCCVSHTVRGPVTPVWGRGGRDGLGLCWTTCTIWSLLGVTQQHNGVGVFRSGTSPAANRVWRSRDQRWYGPAWGHSADGWRWISSVLSQGWESAVRNVMWVGTVTLIPPSSKVVLLLFRLLLTSCS